MTDRSTGTRDPRPYRLGAFNDDLHSDFAEACRLAVDRGVQGLAVRYVGGRAIDSLSHAEVEELRAEADRSGLEIASVGSPYGRQFFLDDDDAQRRAEALLQQMIEFAEILGTTRIRIFTLWLRGQDQLSEWSRRPDAKACMERLVEQLAPSVTMAEAAGMTLMMELEGASYVGTVEEAARVIDAVGSPALALCWDVANGWWSGEAPWPAGYDIAKRLPIVDVQTKDAQADPADPSRLSFGRAVVGQGDVPYDRIIPALLRGGYDGWFTAERVHHPFKPEEHPQLQRDYLADIDNLRALLEAACAERDAERPEGR